MASRHEIKCVHKTDHKKPHERISAIGGVYTNGSPWTIAHEHAVASIERGVHQFYVRAGHEEVDVVVAVSRSGTKYLKTAADGDDEPTFLLSIHECAR